VEEIVATELGVRNLQGVLAFDPVPIAAPPWGQVHSARCAMDDWSWSKCNDPTFANTIADDFEVLEQIADFLDAHTESAGVTDFSKSWKSSASPFTRS